MKTSSLSIIRPDSPLLAKIKSYKKRATEIKLYLDKHPHEWGKFQSEFNQEINSIFRTLMLFEKEQLTKGREEKVYKLKNLFINRFRKDFLHGEYCRWSLEKPFGYAGDFKIIDNIYLNQPKSLGFDRLCDNYFLSCAASVATRNRKEDFKSLIKNCLKDRQNQTIQIMDVASGPCRDLKELLSDPIVMTSKLNIDCYEIDIRAIDYASNLLEKTPLVNFVQKNVVRFALKKDIESEIRCKYDLIFSTGLFDYLDERISLRLITNLKKLLKSDGMLAIANYMDKYSNSSLHFMEWVGDWNLIYRTEEEFIRIFKSAGFFSNQLTIRYEQQGIIQYILATKA